MTSNPPASPFRLPAILICFGLYIIWGFGYETVWRRLRIELDGTIISSSSLPYPGAPRYRTDYVVRSDDGRQIRYTAGATDASLPRGLPPGVKLTKHRWELGYRLNATWVAFPVYFYGPILGAAVLTIGFGIIRYRNDRRAEKKVVLF